MILRAIVSIIVFLVAACVQDPVSTSRTNNPNVDIDLMFMHNGCSMYRFPDDGHYVYWTEGCSSTINSTHSEGKNGSHNDVVSTQ